MGHAVTSFWSAIHAARALAKLRGFQHYSVPRYSFEPAEPRCLHDDPDHLCTVRCEGPGWIAYVVPRMREDSAEHYCVENP